MLRGVVGDATFFDILQAWLIDPAVSYGTAKRWIFPREDCKLLDIHNTTAEELATWVAGRILAELDAAEFQRPRKLMVEVEESAGQLGRYERLLEGS